MGLLRMFKGFHMQAATGNHAVHSSSFEAISLDSPCCILLQQTKSMPTNQVLGCLTILYWEK